MKMLMLATSVISWALVSLNHPLLMVLSISLQTLVLCLLLLSMTQSAWFSYILFLVFMGGLMVLFIYISSLASNESFSLEFSWTRPFTAFLMLGLGSTAIFLSNAQSIKSLQAAITNTIFKVYTPGMASLTLLTMIFLLLALVVIVNITSKGSGALRSMNV